MSDLAKFIEHTVLRPDTTLQDITLACQEAMKYGFASVCIPPLYVRDARRILGENQTVKVATVVGFPMGYSAIAAKSEEIKRALDDGVDDINAVLNIAAVKSGNWNYVLRDTDSLARATQLRGRSINLILECGLLTEPEIRRVSEIAQECRIDWLKTGTDFHGFPATDTMVRSLRALAAPQIRIKAGGGIKTEEVSRALIAAGANRLSTSASLRIIGIEKI